MSDAASGAGIECHAWHTPFQLANPTAVVRSAAMLLDHVGEHGEKRDVVAHGQLLDPLFQSVGDLEIELRECFLAAAAPAMRRAGLTVVVDVDPQSL